VKTLSIGSFTAAQPELGASFGLEIKRLLTEELGKLGITSELRAKFSCKGEFFFDPESGKVTIDAVLREGRFPRTTCSKEIFDVSDIVALMGGTGTLSPDAEKRPGDLLTSIEKPEPKVEPSQAAPDKTIPARAVAAQKAVYAMEIWRLKADRLNVTDDPTDDDYEPVPIDNQEGLLFAALEADNIYAIRLINNTKQLAAATVTIDGLNMFTFSEVGDYRRLGKVLVPPGAAGVLIKGWHRNNESSFSFKVSDVGEAAVTELRGSGPEVEEEIGVITCRFAPAADLAKNETLPEDEPKSASLGTSKGPEFRTGYRDMSVKIGLDREVISIRYSHPLPPEANL
jgi:hypothetical protein